LSTHVANNCYSLLIGGSDIMTWQTCHRINASQGQ